MTLDVVVVGDVMVDIVTVPTGPLAGGSDTPSRITSLGGGSAANTACWLAWLGASVGLVAAVGDDALGAAAVAELEAAGVRFLGVTVAGAPTGACVVLVDGAGDRTMLPDRGANDALAAGLVESAVGATRWVHLSGYTLLGDGSRAAGRAAIDVARRAGTPWSVDASSAAPIRTVGPDRFLAWVEGCSVLFGNDDELTALGGPVVALEQSAGVVTKHGALGSSWTDGRGSTRVGAEPVAVVDAVGAGDAFDAGYLHARLGGASAVDALEAGARAAAVCLAGVGGRPPRP